MSYVNSEEVIHGCNVNIAVLKILENFQGNIFSEVQYWLNSRMITCKFINTVLQHRCIPKDFSNYSEQLFRRMSLKSCLCTLWSMWKSIWLIRNLIIFFFSRSFHLWAKEGKIFPWKLFLIFFFCCWPFLYFQSRFRRLFGENNKK